MRTKPLHAGIARYLANTKPRLTVKEMGGVLVIGKASTVTRQLAHLANQHSFGPQDCFDNEPDYTPGISDFVLRGR